MTARRPGPMVTAVTHALAGAPQADRDKGAVALALRYAQLIDEATPASKYRAPLRTIRSQLPAGEQRVLDAYDKIADALGQHSVMSDLGPKLLATLVQLGMTPAGRGAQGGSSSHVGGVAAELDEFTKRRNGRGGAREHGS